MGGAVSAEHGIGLEKKGWLGISRSPEEIALMRALKQSFDPQGNPHPPPPLPPASRPPPRPPQPASCWSSRCSTW